MNGRTEQGVLGFRWGGMVEARSANDLRTIPRQTGNFWPDLDRLIKKMNLQVDAREEDHGVEVLIQNVPIKLENKLKITRSNKNKVLNALLTVL